MDSMINLHNMITRLKSVSKRTEKDEIFQLFLEQAQADGTIKEVMTLLTLMFSGKVTFGILKFDPPEPGMDHMEYEDMVTLLKALASRSLTGGAAKEAIKVTFTGKASQYVELFTWIVNKDPECGYGVKSINKFIDPPISMFYQQKPLSLMQKNDEGMSEVHWDSLPVLRRYMIEIKYDGNRAYLVVPESPAKAPYFLSSNGHVLVSMESFSEYIVNKLGQRDCVIDCELVHPDGVEKTGSILRRGTDQGLDSGVEMYAIGMLTMEEWNKSYTARTNITNEEMRRRVKLISSNAGCVPMFHLSRCRIFEGHNREAFDKFMRQAVSAGFEGLVIKDPDAFYDRSHNNRAGWWKAKYVDAYDAVIIDFIEGKKSKKGMLGSFIVEYNGKHHRVGGSLENPSTKEKTLSDEKRLDYWIRRNELVDKVIRVQSYGLTKDGHFRHAALINFHDEK